MNSYLFLFTIGPVQSFISQARKTQDLSSGSFILSELTESSMKKLKDLKSNEDYISDLDFIFPAENLEDKPNRFLARIESENIDEIGNRLKKSVEQQFEDMAIRGLSESLTKKIFPKINSHTRRILIRHAQEYPQAYWVALPVTEETYSQQYTELESSLGAIKNVRHFQQLKEEGKRKCSLCGERNVLFYSGDKRPYTPDSALKMEDVDNNSQHAKYMDDGEGLCGVCFVKRFADMSLKKEVPEFPSTAEISLMDFLDKVKEEKPDLIVDYQNLFGNKFDYELYFEENLTEDYFTKNELPLEKLDKAQSKLSDLKELGKKLEALYSSHYAIIILDGDSMGRWLSGKYLKNGNEPHKLLDFHRKLTKELGQYAEKVESLVEEHKGALIYAGGDDVLALVNLNDLLPLIKKLRDEFPKFEEIKEVSNDKRSTASCGISIAHYKSSLSEVLKQAREMENKAKSIDNGNNKTKINEPNNEKDAFAVAVLTRSGARRELSFKWKYGDLSVVETLNKLIDFLKQEKLSTNFIRNFGTEFQGWADNKEEGHDLRDLMEKELQRLIKRSNKSEGREATPEKDEDLNDLIKNLTKLYEKSGLEDFLSFLYLADFLTRKVS